MKATANEPKPQASAVAGGSAFRHKQPVAIRNRRLGVAPDGRNAFFDDWSEAATIRATKRDMRPMGYWVVRFSDGAELCVHEERLRAA